jgi:hypothetical protein
VQVVDDGFRVMAETHQRDAEHGAGPAPAAHAVHGDALAAMDVRDHVVRRRVNDGALAFRVIGRTAAHEIRNRTPRCCRRMS